LAPSQNGAKAKQIENTISTPIEGLIMPSKTGQTRPRTRLGLASLMPGDSYPTRRTVASAKAKPRKVAPRAHSKPRGKSRN
jgi:hypothetical protein